MTAKPVIKMTTNECVRDCIYAVEGICCLKNRPSQKLPQCPFREGTLAAITIL